MSPDRDIPDLDALREAARTPGIRDTRALLAWLRQRWPGATGDALALVVDGYLKRAAPGDRAVAAVDAVATALHGERPASWGAHRRLRAGA